MQGWPAFRGRQLAEWLYKRHAAEIDEMTSLSKAARAELGEAWVVGRSPPVEVQESADGTRKYLFPAGLSHHVESVVIPDDERATLCMSTQVGCRRACRFCMTGQQGFQGNLTAAEMINQYASLPERDQISNIVLMGMGEPLDNADAVFRLLEVFTAAYGYAMSPSRLTLSTVGILPPLKAYLDRFRSHLALSVHSPFDEERAEWMPVQRKYPLAEIIALLRATDWHGQRRLTLEYIMCRGLNDSVAHARELARRFRGLRCRINLIPFHGGTGLPFTASGWEQMERFQQNLKAEGFITHIRRSRGQDIAAACGQLTSGRNTECAAG